MVSGNAAVGNELFAGNGELMTLDQGSSEAIVNGLSASDVEVTADINMNFGGSTVGLDARVNGDTEYRGEIIWSSSYGYTAEILSEIDGVWTTLDARLWNWPIDANLRPTDLGLGNLRFEVDGSQLGLYLGNQLVAAAIDGSITAPGTVGVYGDGTVAVDNFTASAYVPPTPLYAILTTSSPFNDNFGRADNAIFLGDPDDQDWTQQTGGMAILDQQLAAMASGTSIATLTGISESDVIVIGQVTLSPNTYSNQSMGLVARYSGSGDNASYYQGELTSDTSGDVVAQIWAIVNGVATTSMPLASATVAASSGELRFEVIGSQLQLFLNDVMVASATDATITAAGMVGAAGSGGVPVDYLGNPYATVYTPPTLGDFEAQLPQAVANSWLSLPTQTSGLSINYWTPGSFLSDVQSGDFNGDGKSDFVGLDPATGNLVVGLSNGTTGFTTQVWGSLSTSTTWSNVVTGDFSGNGLTDVAAYDAATGQWTVAASSGSSFTTSVWATWNPEDSYQDVQVGDFNGDGRVDLAAWDVTTGTWQVAISNGSSFTTSSWGEGTAGANWQFVVVGDVNGDGRSDLAALDPTTGHWHVEQSTGTSFIDSVWSTANSSDWTSAQAGDFTGNGLTDLIGTVAGNPAWQVALSTGTGFTISSWGDQAENLTNVVVADFDGDGKADLAGEVAGTNDWRQEISTGSGFTDADWFYSSAAVQILGAIAGNTLGLTLAAAKDFETVYNTIQYQPYAGEMKGPLATEESGAGNDWDQDALLSQLLNEDGIQTRYVYGVVEAPATEVENWLAVKDDTAAETVLNDAGLNATIVLADGSIPEQIQFDHAWIEAYLPGPNGLYWYAMDPSFKLNTIQPGIAGLATNEASEFNQLTYLSAETSESPIESYEDQIVQYLQEHDATQSIAEVPYSGTNIAKQFATIPPSLPYTVVSSQTPTTSIPWSMQERIVINVQDGTWVGGGSLFLPDVEFTYEFSLPQVSLDTIMLTYTSIGGGLYLPELRLNGVTVASGLEACGLWPPSFNNGIQIEIDSFNAGNTTDTQGNYAPDGAPTYINSPGVPVAIGIDVDQFSEASLIALQGKVNADSLAYETGETTDPMPAFYDGMSLAMTQYLYSVDQSDQVIAGLNGLIDIHSGVGTGTLASDPTNGQIQYNWGNPVPIASVNTSFNVGGGGQTFDLNYTPATGSTALHDTLLETYELMALNNSDFESRSLRNRIQRRRRLGCQWNPIRQRQRQRQHRHHHRPR